MTEREWATCTFPEALVAFLRGRVSDRKLRLFGCACCRAALPLLKDPRTRRVVETAERYADGLASERELAAAEAEAEAIADGARGAGMKEAAYAVKASAHADAPQAARGPWWHIARAEIERRFAFRTRERRRAAEGKIYRAEQQRQTKLLRCIVGNPFHCVAFSPSWRTDTVLALAQQIYESCDFSPMPILADALQDAGCDSAEILDHCRDTALTHVRGCWVVDLVLEKG
jgi:hypothetical protein